MHQSYIAELNTIPNISTHQIKTLPGAFCGCFCLFLVQVRNQKDKEGEGGEVSPTLFRKLEIGVLIWGKNVLIVAIHGLNFSFKMLFLRVSRRENSKFSLWSFSSLCYRCNIYRTAIIPRKLPCPEKFLVMFLLDRWCQKGIYLVFEIL